MTEAWSHSFLNCGRAVLSAAGLLILAGWFAATTGCGSSAAEQREQQFFTSGSQEADQRARQRMAQAEQIANTDDGTDVVQAPSSQAILAKGKLTLFDRLGGETGISNIVGDFLPRALNDPRINWARDGVTQGGIFRPDKSVTWDATPEDIRNLEKHLVQFLSLAAGGPAEYDGRGMKSVHADMKITNHEFDATVGDFKASLDKLLIPDREQKELLAIIESTRPQVVTEQ